MIHERSKAEQAQRAISAHGLPSQNLLINSALCYKPCFAVTPIFASMGTVRGVARSVAYVHTAQKELQKKLDSQKE